MISRLKESLRLIDSSDRLLICFFGLLRILVGVLDVGGILLIGLLLKSSASSLSGVADKDISSNQNFDFLERFQSYQLAVIALSLFVAKSLIAVSLSKIMFDRFARSEATISNEMYQNFLSQPLSKLKQKSKSQYSFALTYGATYGISNVLNMSIIVLSEFFLLISILLVFAFVNFQLTIVMLIYFVLISFVIFKITGSKLQQFGSKASVHTNQAVSTIEDSIDAYREIFTLHKQEQFSKKFNKSRSKLANSVSKMDFLLGLPRHIIESALIIGAAGILAISLLSGNLVDAAESVGIFIAGSFRIMASLLPLQNALSSLKQLVGRADEFYELSKDLEVLKKKTSLDEKPESTNHNGQMAFKLNDVTFAYPNSEKLALKGVSLEVNRGEMVALVGPSGSGKSTLADIILGLLQPTSGVLKTDKDLQNEIGYVPQSPGLVQGTILQNITLNVDSNEFNEKKLLRAVRLANLSEFIENLPNKLETNLGPQSSQLSGGQRQRIGLARALYSEPKLLILDEATSALDMESEFAITESLKELKNSTTVVVIAHRLSTVKNADQVFVIDDGFLVASGSFKELSKSNNLISRYVELSELKID